MTPQPMTLSIPIVAGALVAWLKDDQLPPWLNYLIIVILFALAVTCSIVVNGGLTGNAGVDLYTIIGTCVAIFTAIITSQASSIVPSPLSGVAANMAQKAEQQREFAQWQASLQPQVSRASTPKPTPPPGGGVFAPPSTPADQPTRLDLPAIPPSANQQQPPTNP